MAPFNFDQSWSKNHKTNIKKKKKNSSFRPVRNIYSLFPSFLSKTFIAYFLPES